MNLTPLEPRDCPTAITLAVGDDPLGWWTPPRVAVAESAAADLSARLDAPGYDTWRVELHSSTASPLIAQATGTDGWGAVWVGPALAAGYDERTVLLHELGHTLGVGHGDDPAGVMWPYIAAGEVREWRASDDELATAAGLVVTVPAEVPPPTAPVMAEVYPYTESHPFRGPLMRVPCPWGPGWADVPPRVAAEWGGNFMAARPPTEV